MTHAHKRLPQKLHAPLSSEDVELPWLKPPYLTVPPAPTQPPPALDPNELVALRQFVDDAGAARACRQPECRKARRCRGPCRPAIYWPHHPPLPLCLAMFFEQLYASVASFYAFRDWIEDITAKIQAKVEAERAEDAAKG
jgi:hypothetical protein